MDKSNKIDYILQHITTLLTKDSDQILLEQLGIDYSQYKILRVLYNHQEVKQRYICSVLGQTEASISRQIDILKSKNYITKTIDLKNKRVRLIKITSKGLNITNASTKVIEKYYKSLLEGFNDKNKQELLKLLEELHGKICQYNHTNYLDNLNTIVSNYRSQNI